MRMKLRLMGVVIAYINVIFVVGHFDEGTELVERVIRTEPVVTFPSRDQQWNLIIGRRYRKAETEYQRSRDFEGDHTLPDYIAFLRTLALEPSNRAAVLAAYERVRNSFGPESTSIINGFRPVLDNRAAMRAMVRKLVEDRRPNYEGAFVLADALNDPEGALISVRASLNRPDAADFRNYWNLWMMPYSRVRTLPGFKALLRKAGIVDYWRKTGNWGDFCKPVGADDFECR